MHFSYLQHLRFKLYYFTALNIGQPKRHLLTSGWSIFVTAKKLVAGDACIFLRFSLSLSLSLWVYLLGFLGWVYVC